MRHLGQKIRRRRRDDDEIGLARELDMADRGLVGERKRSVKTLSPERLATESGVTK